MSCRNGCDHFEIWYQSLKFVILIFTHVSMNFCMVFEEIII